MSTSAFALLITTADGAHQVFVGSDERAYRHAFGAFVNAWGRSAVWYDELAKQLGCDGGVTLSRWRARVLGRRTDLALVVMCRDVVVGIYLVDDSEMAERAVAGLDGEDVAFDLVATEPLTPADPLLDAIPLEGVVHVRQGEPRPLAPVPPLSSEFCPRCSDHPLHVDPLFDAVSPEGGRMCIACARLATLREAANQG